MSFSPNKTPIEIIKEGTFGGTYFRDIYSSINGKWYRNSWKEFDFYVILILNCIRVIIMMLMLINIK